VLLLVFKSVAYTFKKINFAEHTFLVENMRQGNECIFSESILIDFEYKLLLFTRENDNYFTENEF
jgi:hypothetical protein